MVYHFPFAAVNLIAWDSKVQVIGRLFFIRRPTGSLYLLKDSFRGGIYLPGSTPLLWLGKKSGVPRGVKAVPRYAAGLGRIWQADERSPLLSGVKKG